MKKVFLSLSLSVVIASSLKAQNINITSGAAPIKMVCATPVSANPPLVFVNGFETNLQSAVLDPKNIKAITVLKNKVAIEKYGEKANGGVLLIATKPGTEFYTIADFINVETGYNTSVKQIELNGRVLSDMTKVLIDKKAFSGTTISSGTKVNEKNCDVVLNDTLVVATTHGLISDK